MHKEDGCYCDPNNGKWYQRIIDHGENLCICMLLEPQKTTRRSLIMTMKNTMQSICILIGLEPNVEKYTVL